jgi:phage terminase large subunit-like protein
MIVDGPLRRGQIKGVPNLADTVKVKHTTGRWSSIGLKSYDQGRRVFQGTAKHWIWLDEEPPADVYGEALIRLMTLRGIMLVTFTPLRGISDVVMSFMPEDHRPSE